ncbi:hypothetical protein CUO_1152 [Enterococcus faecium PC4.1]|nr:hypothetical protein CUO_1152 [Enterococcus faecium PC4.1]
MKAHTFFFYKKKFGTLAFLRIFILRKKRFIIKKIRTPLE